MCEIVLSSKGRRVSRPRLQMQAIRQMCEIVLSSKGKESLASSLADAGDSAYV